MLIESLIFVALWQDGSQIKSPKQAAKQKKKASNARRDAKAVTGGMTGAKWGGRLGGKWGKRVGAGLGAAVGGHRGKKQGGEQEEGNQEEGKQKKVSRTRLLAKEGAKALADAKLKKLAWANAVDTFGLSVVAYYGVKHWRVTLTIIIILFLIFFIIFDDSTFDAQQSQDMTPATSDTCNPAQFANQDAFNKTSVCTITVTYNGSAQDIIIKDTILPGTAFVSADHNGIYDSATGTVTWDAQSLNLPLNPVNITVTVTIRITTMQDNTIVYNAYAISPVGLTSAIGGGSISGNIPANHDTCAGKYTLTSPLGNFGDPQCNFTHQALGTELSQLDPGNAVVWDCIAYYESTDDPNAYNGNSTSGFGAYGLFQMNPPGKGNNQYDNGGVNWSVQISNAINYNKGIGGNFGYWGTYHTNGGPC